MRAYVRGCEAGVREDAGGVQRAGGDDHAGGVDGEPRAGGGGCVCCKDAGGPGAGEEDFVHGCGMETFCAVGGGGGEVGYWAAAFGAGGAAVAAGTAEVGGAVGVARDGGGAEAGEMRAPEEFEGGGGVWAGAEGVLVGADFGGDGVEAGLEGGGGEEGEAVLGGPFVADVVVGLGGLVFGE